MPEAVGIKAQLETKSKGHMLVRKVKNLNFLTPIHFDLLQKRIVG